MIDLEKYQPTPHPYRSVFADHGVSQCILARFCSVSQSQISIWLRGLAPIPEKYQRKLEILVSSLSGGNDDEA